MAMIDYLRLMTSRKASDLILSVGAPAALKIEGETHLLDGPVLDSTALTSLVQSVFNESQKRLFADLHELTFTASVAELGRFRISAYRQRGEPAAVTVTLSKTAVAFVPATWLETPSPTSTVVPIVNVSLATNVHDTPFADS